jgi:DNA-binding CsgD family transcriptional regulator
MPRRRRVDQTSNVAGLTPRQIEILRLVATGMSNAEIARLLVVSTRTVDHHVAAVFAKLDVHSRRQAAGLLESLGLEP